MSLEDQGARIADYCRAQGWQLVEVLADDGVSGGRRERLERMTERVRVTGARFVVYHLDRFARDLAGTLDYLRRFSRRGVELHVVGRGRIEADSASGFIVTAIESLPPAAGASQPLAGQRRRRSSPEAAERTTLCYPPLAVCALRPLP